MIIPDYKDYKCVRIKYSYWTRVGKYNCIPLRVEDLTQYNRAGDIILLETVDVDKFQLNKINTLNGNETLYFSKASSFPRTKLTDTSFKRCIKLDKADAVVINPNSIPYSKMDGTAFFKDDANKTIYVFWNFKYDASNFLEGSGYQKTTATINDVIDVFKNVHKINVDVLYQGSISSFSTKSYERYLELQQLEANKTKVIDDDTLDSIISKKCESLTEESLNMLSDMLASSDQASVDLALKLLPNYNIEEFKLTIKTILALNARNWCRSKVAKSTMFKQLLSTFNCNFNTKAGFPSCLYGIASKQETFSDEDLAFSKLLIKQQVNKQIEREIGYLRSYCQAYNLNININVD